MKKLVSFVLLLVPCCALHKLLINDPAQDVQIQMTDSDADPDVKRNVSQMISTKGYPVENHWVTTKDGYILSVQRIPYGINGSQGNSKGVVLCVHGLFGTAENFVFDFPQQSLGFLLADHGYDVWVANVRGTRYSKRHTNYTTYDREFWDYSFQDIAAYDLPALIDYVLEKTGKQKLSYVGHSQGTLVAFALLSESPYYNQKINLFGAMGPAAYLGNIPPGSNRLLFTTVYTTGPALGDREVNGSSPILSTVKQTSCPGIILSQQNSSQTPVCTAYFYEFSGQDQQINQTRLPVYMSHFPDSTSTKNLYHLSQLVVNNGTFRKYDYGQQGNMDHYKQSTPPDYDLTCITAPVALMWSQADDLTTAADVAMLRSKLGNLVGNYQVPYDPFHHIDFIVALQGKSLVYDYLIGLLDQVWT